MRDDSLLNGKGDECHFNLIYADIKSTKINNPQCNVFYMASCEMRNSWNFHCELIVVPGFKSSYLNCMVLWYIGLISQH